jgi:hypothetical protein
LNNQQHFSEKHANFSVGSISLLLAAIWLAFAAILTGQGFGNDTDAWLMAQTAGRIRAGEGYDPARSLGNPLWEYLLAFLQPDFAFRISNGLNLLLALWFLFRLRAILPELSEKHKWPWFLVFCLLPVFTEAATSSMEYLPAWLLLLESLIALRNEKNNIFTVLCLLAGFTRPEFTLYLIVTALFFKPRLLVRLLIPAISTGIYLIWVTGKNPLPFSTIEEIPVFYAGRIWFLLRQAGLLLPVYLLLISLSLWQKDSMLKWPGKLSLFFFLFFPFEWAYAFPSMLSGGILLMARMKKVSVLGLLLPLLAASLISSFLFSLSGLPALYTQRKHMLWQYQHASAFKPERQSLLLDGATFLPTRFQAWERSHQNRLFHKTGSHFWVAERLTRLELDSFRREGFQLLRFSENPDEKYWLKEFEEQKPD